MTGPNLETFLADARRWLDLRLPLRKESAGHIEVGDPFNTAVFHSLTFAEEAALLGELRAWNQQRATRGYHAVTWPVEDGGLGLDREHGRAFARLEAEYETPRRHELFNVTTQLIAPTVRELGDSRLRERFVGPLLRTEIYCCQLFSEPSAGSDLAALGCRARRDGDDWIVNGQKVWSSGAQFAEWGELIARTDPDVPKHRGLTAFLVPMDLPGIVVRPIKQMTGGSSFNEVFFTDVRVPDRLRLGPVGSWMAGGPHHARLRARPLRSGKRHTGRRQLGPRHRDRAGARSHQRSSRSPSAHEALHPATGRGTGQPAGGRPQDERRAPGPEGSLGKLLWTEGMRKMSDTISALVGPALIADSGRWATYEWSEHVLGAPGYRIAGGSDEVQRTIIGERVLGLPPEPRIDKDVPWNTTTR